jgi:hypothetical protein
MENINSGQVHKMGSDQIQHVSKLFVDIGRVLLTYSRIIEILSEPMCAG